MTTTYAAPSWFKFRWTQADGTPAAGWQVYTYIAGTTTPISTYTDEAGDSSNGTSFTLNSRGEANCWLEKEESYKFAIYDHNGESQDTIGLVRVILQTS